MNRSKCLALLCLALAAAIVPLGATGSSGSGTIAISDTTPIPQDFNSLSNSTTPSTALPTGWYLTEIGTGAAADGAYVVGIGSSNAGGAYSFGAAADTDRALGSVGSGSAAPIYFGARFTNAGSGPITTLSVSYDGELWRRGPSSTPDGLVFSYSTDASNLTTGTFTNVSALNFTSPGNGCTAAAGATNGNIAACRTSISSTITGLSVNPGSTIWIRWMDADTVGSDDGVAIDNVTVAAAFSTAPTPPTSTASASPNPSNPGQAVALAGMIAPGFNPLSQRYTVACDLSAIGGSTNEILLNDSTVTTFNYPFTISAEAPLGSSTLPCSVTDDQSRHSLFSVAITVVLPLNDNCGAAATPVSSIQGAGALSPLTGQIVDVEAIVVGDFQAPGGLSGFYVEAPAGEQDGHPETSEGVFIFSSLVATEGDRVRVRGTVAEFQSATGSLVSHLTEIGAVSSVQVCRSGEPLPPPIDVMLPIDDISHWERYEGMLVRFTQQLVVTGNFNLGHFGQVDLAPSVLYQPTQRKDRMTWDFAADLVSRSLIALDDGSTQSDAGLNGGTVAPYPAPGLSASNTLRVGALVNANGDNPPSPLVGILDDRFGTYRVQPLSAVSFSNVSNPRPDTAAIARAAGARFRIVSANVLNFFTTLGSRGAAMATELAHQRSKIVAELAGAQGDVIGLSELQNFSNGQTSGGTYTNAAIADLTSALGAATGRNYRYVDSIDGANLAPGNVVADNGTDAIRSGLIYDADTVMPTGIAALYNQNDQNRPSLAQTFRPATGLHPDQQTFTVVVNHFRSKGSPCGPGNDDLLQGNCNGMRLGMAQNVMSWLESNPTADPAGANRRYVVVGDFNAYFGEDPIQAFLAGPGGFTDLINLVVGDAAYSYNFGSQAGYLDHALVNTVALPLVKDVVELHVNADEPAALEALGSSSKSATAQVAYFSPNEFAASDHDPIVIGFNPLSGDFDDDGMLGVGDRQMLLRAVEHGNSPVDAFDRRMDLNQDGVVDQQDFLIWQSAFISWQQNRK